MFIWFADRLQQFANGLFRGVASKHLQIKLSPPFQRGPTVKKIAGGKFQGGAR